MTGEQSTFDWTPLCDTSFNKVKLALIKGAVIKPLDYELAKRKEDPHPIYLITDASLIGTGAWIGQGPTLDKLRPAGFHSRRFNTV